MNDVGGGRWAGALDKDVDGASQAERTSAMTCSRKARTEAPYEGADLGRGFLGHRALTKDSDQGTGLCQGERCRATDAAEGARYDAAFDRGERVHLSFGSSTQARVLELSNSASKMTIRRRPSII